MNHHRTGDSDHKTGDMDHKTGDSDQRTGDAIHPDSWSSDRVNVTRTGEPGVPAGADPRRWWALVIIALAQLMVVLDATIVNIALPPHRAI